MDCELKHVDVFKTFENRKKTMQICIYDKMILYF